MQQRWRLGRVLHACGIGAFIAVAATLVAASPAPLPAVFDSCALTLEEEEFCVTKSEPEGHQYFVCEETGGAGECITCYVDPLHLCPTEWGDLPNKSDQVH